MTKFNYTKWVTENKHGKTLKESMYGDDVTVGLAVKALQRGENPGVDSSEIVQKTLWNKYNLKQKIIIIDNSDIELDPIKQEALAQLSYDDLMKKLSPEDEGKLDYSIYDGLTDKEMKRTSEALNEELDANKIKDSLKNLAKEKDLPGFGPTTTIDDDVRSDLVGIILPSLEKANAPEELIKNLETLSNKYNTDQGVSLAQQPDEVKNAITYLTGDKAQKSVDQIGDVAGGYADALKPGTEKIYTADAFPDGLKDSDFYKKSVEDGWKFITKNSLTPDQEKIAKSLPTKSDGTPLKEKSIAETDDDFGPPRRPMTHDEFNKKFPDGEDDEGGKPEGYDDIPSSLREIATQLGYLNEIDGMEDSDDEDLRLEPEDSEYEDGTEFYDEEDYDFDPEDGVVDEIELKDLDFKTLKAAFPKFYQKVKFTRMQSNGEEGPYYEDAISFPNLDDSSTVIGDASALEDWKDKVSRRFGNVEMEFNDQAKNHWDRVFVHSDDFNDERDSFIRGKMKALNR
jgi:hypothetical protein